jgi:site-specific DNA-methyltransferase (adenine-specific)
LKEGAIVEPFYTSAFGALFSSDCMEVLPLIKDGVVDTVFADPPFNLGKEYGENCNDLKPDEDLLK